MTVRTLHVIQTQISIRSDTDLMRDVALAVFLESSEVDRVCVLMLTLKMLINFSVWRLGQLSLADGSTPGL